MNNPGKTFCIYHRADYLDYVSLCHVIANLLLMRGLADNRQ